MKTGRGLVWMCKRLQTPCPEIEFLFESGTEFLLTSGSTKAENCRAARAILPRHRSHRQFQETLQEASISGAQRFRFFMQAVRLGTFELKGEFLGPERACR
jgi:hypothetical protein